jgi:hypothetical protein
VKDSSSMGRVLAMIYKRFVRAALATDLMSQLMAKPVRCDLELFQREWSEPAIGSRRY